MLGRNREWGLARWWLLGLLAAHVALGLHAARSLGLTTDEMAHLASGRLAWSDRDYRLDPIHPPLARLWLASPLALDDLAPPVLGPRDLRWNRFVPAVHGWIHAGGDARGLVFRPRVLNLAWTAALVVTLWVALRRHGRETALLGAGLAALSPHLLAHGSLATTDAALIAAFTWATIAVARLARCVSPLRLAVACLAVAICITVKFSGLLMLPVALLVAAVRTLSSLPVHWRCGRSTTLRSRSRKAAALAGALIAVVLFAWLSVWAVHGFRYSAGPPEVETGSHLGADYWRIPEEHRGGKPAALFEQLREARLLPEAYLYGVMTIALREGAREAYFLGEHKRAGGWWAYFPVALSIKTPGITLLLLLAGLVVGLGRWWKRRRISGRSLVWPAALTAALFGLATMSSRMNIGVRHALPLLPMALLICAPGAAAALRRLRRGLLPVALVLGSLLAIDLVNAPHFLCYFNRLAGGRAGGSAYLADSNIDWGQGLPELAAYQREVDPRPVTLLYLGMDLPSAYGIAVVPPREFRPGRYVVSLNFLAGLRVRWSPADETRYRLLSGLAAGTVEPDGRIGCSLAWFDLDRDELDRLLGP